MADRDPVAAVSDAGAGGAARSTTTSRLVSVTLPAGSLERTKKRKVPLPSAPVCAGDVHAVNVGTGAPTGATPHANVANGSGELKAKAGVASAVGPTGPARMLTAGATVSTTTARVATGPTLPAASVARTRSV